jgi:hypothetical protein
MTMTQLKYSGSYKSMVHAKELMGFEKKSGYWPNQRFVIRKLPNQKGVYAVFAVDVKKGR